MGVCDGRVLRVAFYMELFIPLSQEEEKLLNCYAKRHNISLEEAFKQALFEKIEDEYDLALANAAYQSYLDEGKKRRPIEELWQELGL